MNYHANYNNSAKSSLLSDKTNSISSLNDSRGIILENLDGTYHHGTYENLKNKCITWQIGVMAKKPKEEEINDQLLQK